jgi:predicted DNA-binding protein (UPF0251 family)
MGAKRSAETKEAIRLHQVEGKSVHQAAKLAGIYPTTLYKALYPQGKKIVKKGLDSV